MNDSQDSLDLTVSVSPLELARLQRRVAYLEAALVQVLRHGRRVKEWYTAAELASLRLPGLPRTASSIARLAREGDWLTLKGACHAYHFSSLPRRTFEALIDLVLRSPAPAPEAPAPSLPEPPPLSESPANMAPPWVLPLMRLMRIEGGDVKSAVKELPRHLPEGVPQPSYGEAMEVLRRLGMVS